MVNVPISAMRTTLSALLITCLWHATASGQCAPAPDSPYFFRNLSEQRAEAKIDVNAAVFEQQLSDSFSSRSLEGKLLNKRDFIAVELAARPAIKGRRFYSISNYSLLEHRKGYTVASYQLIEGVTGNGAPQLVELQLREVYEVIDGKWRLASVEATPAVAPATAAVN